MSNFGFSVPAKSWNEIDSITEDARRMLGTHDEPYINVADVIEKCLDQKLGILRLEVVEDKELPTVEAEIRSTGDLITLRESVYEKAHAGDGRARFTLAHELGHFFLHCGGVPAYALSSGERVPAYCDSEKQADYFAASLLMPHRFFTIRDNVHSIVNRHQVSAQAARFRLSYLSSKGKLNWT